jgi:hypothetical protein
MRHPQAAHEDTSLEDVIGQDETPRLPTKAPTRETQDLLTIPVDDVPSCIPDIDPEDTQLETVRTCSTLSHQIEESPARETTPVDDHEPSLPGDSSMEPFVSEETSEDNHSTEGDQTTGVLKPEREQPVSVHRSHFPFFEVEESIAEPSIFEDDRRSSHSDNTFGLEHLFTDYSPATQPSGGSGLLKTRGLRLLFFENGVVYGLSALYVLRDIMDYANSHKYHTYEDRKPCDVFDLIGGTGTGGQVDFLR